MAGIYLKGALVEFVKSFLLPVPNVIIFQYNPETLTHAWTQPGAAPANQYGASNPLAVKGSPGETFQFTITMDANDMISDGECRRGSTGYNDRDILSAGRTRNAAISG